jgi:hypothetical protein
MKRPGELRASPKDWVAVLEVVYPFLSSCGIGNLLLFGSQAMSFYMGNPLRSKDLDILTDQFGPTALGKLTKTLSEQRPADAEVKTNNVQTRFFDGRIMRTYSIEMRIRKRPFFLEVFDATLDGRPPSILTPYVRRDKRWGLDLWVPSREAVVCLRLCFRQPEGINRLNATRLNHFIKDNKAKLNEKQIGKIILSWRQANLVRKNLAQLEKLHRLKIIGQEKILAAIEAAEK